MRRQRLYNGVRFPAGGPCLANVERLDLGARPIVAHMMRRGMRIDPSHFERMAAVLTDDMERITAEVEDMTGVYCNLGSGPQVSTLLFKTLGLKQARTKFTPTGDRESVENEVLVAIQHVHPAISKILDYKEIDKLKGTYVVPIPKLAKRVAFGEWRLFPNLGDTRVPSGRLNCIAKGTLIEVVRDVSKYPKGIPIEDIKVGDLAYCFDKNQHLSLRRVLRVIDNGHSRVLRIYWRGTGGHHRGHVDLTSDHLVRLTTGSYTPAGQLQRGDAVCALSRGVNGYGYARLWATGMGEIRAEHRFIWSALHNWKTPKHIHHKNGNKLDNRRDNLINLHGGRHIQTHMSGRTLTQEHRRKLRIAYWTTGLGSKSPEQLSSYQDGHKLNLSREWILSELDRCGGHPTRVCQDNKMDYETFQKYLRKWDIDWKDVAKRHQLESNHIIEGVVDIGDQRVYDLEVQDCHNFIAGEICVHNCKEPNLLAMPNRTERGRQVCEGFITDDGWTLLSVDESQIEPRVVAHRSGDPALRGVYYNEEDIYSDFAIAAFKLKDERYQDEEGWHYPGVDKKLHRFPSKTCTLASIYEVTNVGLLEQMPVVCRHCHREARNHSTEACERFAALWNEDNCQDLINAFYSKYPGVLHMRKRDHATARRYGYLWDEWGRILHVVAVRSVLEWVVSAALREAGNFPIQSTARGTVKLTAAAVYDDMTAMRMFDVAHPILDIHDELLFECREDVADDLAALVTWHFEHCVELEVPIKAGSAKALNWGILPK